jgi:transcriptional regulator with XRE-family HTH domain/energy-coupling factor transporter ATP-binding protein EcfA2
VTDSWTATFGALLRQYRLQAGLSQETLAERARLSASAIAALERGRRNAPYPGTLTLLAEALGLTPDERAALVEASRRGPVAGASPLAPASAPSSVAVPALVIAPLPAPPTALIGRERAEAEVVHLLRPGAARLVTLTGPGGVGKSRLALAVAAVLRGAYPDGVAFVDVAPIRDPTLVPATIARALGLDVATGSTIQPLAERLREERLLLVLDNVEQVVDAAPLLADLIAACPHLALLVTSRTALRVRAEQRFSVPTLALPATGQSLEDVVSSMAVRLFVARARGAAGVPARRGQRMGGGGDLPARRWAALGGRVGRGARRNAAAPGPAATPDASFDGAGGRRARPAKPAADVTRRD